MKRRVYQAIVVSLVIFTGILSCCKKEEKYVPSLMTVMISSATKDSVLMGGLILNDGGADITSRGVCYGTSASPNISGSRTTNGRGKGTFMSLLTGLSSNTSYYARAYATNSEGTGYGNEITFKTLPGVIVAPMVATSGPYCSFYYAEIGGRIISDGGAPVIEKGFFWSTSKNPSIEDDKLIYTESFANNFYYRVDSLQPDSYYYARAYAINSADTGYGNIVPIKTLAVPEVATLDVTGITRNSAVAGGNIISLGNASDVLFGYSVEAGICYGTGTGPAIEGLHVRSATTAIGEFTCNLEGLESGVQYYLRAYVKWGDEWIGFWVVYGNEVTFTTP